MGNKNKAQKNLLLNVNMGKINTILLLTPPNDKDKTHCALLDTIKLITDYKANKYSLTNEKPV